LNLGVLIGVILDVGLLSFVSVMDIFSENVSMNRLKPLK